MKRLIIVTCVVTACLALGAAALAAEKVIFEKNSLYQYISVIEDSAKKERYIINNRRDLIQGGMSTEAPDRLILEYTRMAFISLVYLGRDPRSVLFVGLGAGSMPRYLQRFWPDAEIDIVEIDPDIVDVAKKYFRFSETAKLKVHVNDGRVFLKRNPKKYDIIFLDAYQGGEIPFHLTTVEFLREVKGRLNKDGVAVSNILAAGSNRFFDSMVVTHDEVFPLLHIFKARGSANFIFVATPAANLDLSAVGTEALRLQARKKLDLDLLGVANNGEEGAAYRVKAKVLTDDFAPVNLYQHMKRP